jgi:hypothetical protein
MNDTTRVRRAMARHNRTVAELAQATGLSQADVRRCLLEIAQEHADNEARISASLAGRRLGGLR